MSDVHVLTVLLVEDDEALARLYVRQFEAESISCTHAKDGKTALQLLTMVRPSIILLDISLPDIDGFEVLKRIKADPAITNIPVVIMSNYSRPEDIEWGKSLGAKQFVEKADMVPADIIDMVHSVTGL